MAIPEPNSMTTKSLSDAGESSTPEDVATLYSWANLHGAKYRDFSASRAQAREEARLRAEEAAAAERRRLEEEAERKAQEEAQIAARKAAEEAEAARQAEADRLAEIARQAEVERQAVLAAQEAQRQALQQRGWQSPPDELYLGGLAPQAAAASPVFPEFPVGAPIGADKPHVEHAADFGIETGTSYGIEFGSETGQRVHSPSYFELDAPRSDLSGRALPPSKPAPDPRPAQHAHRNEFTRYDLAWPVQDTPANRSADNQNGQHSSPDYRSEPVRFTPIVGKSASSQYPSHPALTRATPNFDQEYDKPPFVPPPSYLTPPESHLPSPWQPREEHEPRESREWASRPAWLVPELPPPSAPVSAPAPPRAMPPYTGPSSLPATVTQQYVPMYAQTVSQSHFNSSQAQSLGPGPNQNPNQNPNQYPGQNSNQGPADDTSTGSHDHLVNRWFALKSVFDPQSAPVEQVPAQPPPRVPVLAVFSLAGGVGKTSLVASLGRALSARGERVLLVDTAAYGLLPFFFGARDQRPGLLRTFNPPGLGAEIPIQLVSLDPDGQPQDTQGQDPNQIPDRGQEWLAQEVARFSRASHRVLVDLPTASGATTRRVLRMAPVVLVPVVPDMNSVVSVGAIESFFRHSGNVAGKQIMPYYVLNQFDYSLPLHLEVREILREQVGDRLLSFALRRSPAVSEALAEGMTVMDYAPSAVVAEDYAHLAQWVRSLAAPASQSSQSFGSVRWSER